jgi:2'-5' RNA ligase
MKGRRMFVAVWPPPVVMEGLALLERPLVPGLRWTTADQWHVTLRFLGSVGEEEADALDHVWHRFDVDSMGFVEAVLGPVTGRFGDRVLVVPVAGLDALANAMVAATADIGERPDPRSFTGHITLARSRGVELSKLAGTPIAARWPVTELTLVVSQTGPAGSRYEIVDRRALPSPP